MAVDIGGAVAGGLSGFGAAGPVGGLLGGIAGGLFGGKKKKPPQVQFNPANINTGGASVAFDKKENTFSASLSPEMQKLQGDLFNKGQGFFQELDTFNPDEFGANVSDRLRRLAAPKESRDRAKLEQRLFNQGILTSTNGGQQSEGLFTAQALAEEARVARGFSLGQDVQGNLLDRGLQSFNAGTALEQLPLGLLNASIGAGSGNLSASKFNAGNTIDFNNSRSDFNSALTSGALDAIGQLGDSGSFDSFNSSFNDFFGIGGGDDFLDASSPSNNVPFEDF